MQSLCLKPNYDITPRPNAFNVKREAERIEGIPKKTRLQDGGIWR